MLASVVAGLGLAATVTSQVAFTFTDPRIAESSGLASSSSGELVFTHNDSGDTARFFAVGLDGRTRTTYTVPGVDARDWEDMARGPDERGRSSLWFADIGDNSASRDRGVLLRRVAEPAPSDAPEVTTEPSTDFRLRYPDRPQDAETLLVHPRTGRVLVVTKPLAGAARVYAAPAELDPAAPNVLELVAEAPTRSTGTAGGPAIGAAANWLVTAGDIAPDGSRVALRTYTDLYEWTVEDDDVAEAFGGEPTVTPLPPSPQGEGLTYAPDGRSVLVSSEGAGAAVHRVVLHDQAVPEQDADAPGQGADEADGPAPLRPDSAPVLVAGAVALAVVAATAAVLAVRRRRRPAGR